MLLYDPDPGGEDPVPDEDTEGPVFSAILRISPEFVQKPKLPDCFSVVAFQLTFWDQLVLSGQILIKECWEIQVFQEHARWAFGGQDESQE